MLTRLSRGEDEAAELREFIPAEQLSPGVMTELKILFSSVPPAGDYPTYFRRVCNEAGRIIQERGVHGSSLERNDSITQKNRDSWNMQRPRPLIEALEGLVIKPCRDKAPPDPQEPMKETTRVKKRVTFGGLTTFPPHTPAPCHQHPPLAPAAVTPDAECLTHDLSELLHCPLIEFDAEEVLAGNETPKGGTRRLRKRRWDVTDTAAIATATAIAGPAHEDAPTTAGDIDAGEVLPNSISDVFRRISRTATAMTEEGQCPGGKAKRARRGREAVDLVDGRRPRFVDADGREKTVDWVGELRAAAVATFAGDICVHRHSDPALYGNIVGTSFRGFSGSRCFLEPNSPVLVVPTPSMLDEAWNAVNSGLAPAKKIQQNFAYYNFNMEPVIDDGHALARAIFQFLPDIDMNLVGRCLLCDQVAELFMGRAVGEIPNGGGQGVMRWAFESEQVARDYVLLCIFLTTGAPDYYISLHKRAQRHYSRSLRAANTVLEGNQGRARLRSFESASHFAVGFGDEKSGRVPFFYLIGRRSASREENSRPVPILTNDFCIVIPDIAFFREHRNTTNTRARRAAGHGRALYFRPVVGSDSGTTE